MEDFNPIRVASEWHGGQFSDLYSYSSTGKVHDLDHKDGLIREIEQCESICCPEKSEELALLKAEIMSIDPVERLLRWTAEENA